jgi:hypothetical protein
LKTKAIITSAGVLFSLLVISTGAVFGQATDGQSVFHFGGGFAKAMVDDAQGGMIGARVSAGKMLTNNLCLGFMAGYDVVSYKKVDELHERLTVIPFQVNFTYFMNVGAMMQFYTSLGGGIYRTLPHLGGKAVGDIATAVTRPGGSVAIGFDYWFLLTTGVGFTFEYHMFDTPDDGSMFKYFVARVDYCLIKF